MKILSKILKSIEKVNVKIIFEKNIWFKNFKNDVGVGAVGVGEEGGRGGPVGCGLGGGGPGQNGAVARVGGGPKGGARRVGVWGTNKQTKPPHTDLRYMAWATKFVITPPKTNFKKF